MVKCNEGIEKQVISLGAYYDSQEFANDYHYNGDDLGAMLTSHGTSFQVWVPMASQVELELYEKGDLEVCSYQTVPMVRGDKGVWSFKTKEQLDGVYYTYRITHDKSDAIKSMVRTGDIYAKACGVNGKKSMVVALPTTNPQGWEQDTYSYNGKLQPIIYELHIKDFSYQKCGGFREENRGKYLAFTEPNTCLNGEPSKPTGVAYLQTLGITHVHILPLYDFGSIDEHDSQADTFNWGYDPVNYNVPEGSYASDAHDGKVRITELKAMILALHQAGIGVIMDVVYNHTYNTDSFFQRTVPYYYYRMDSKGQFANGSGCGNETASERWMYRKYMIDSVMYWAKEYHLDGFRFDLMGLHDVETMNLIRENLNTLPKGENILMYGEPWFAETPCMREGSLPTTKDYVEQLASGIAIFSDDTRDTIKGSVFLEQVGGYINGDLSKQGAIPSCVLAHTDGRKIRVRQTNQVVSYVSAHDNFTLYDKLTLTMQKDPVFHKVDAEVIQVNKLAAGIYLTCCGLCFFQAGEEFARTKQGIGDSYQSPPSINQLDYQRAYELADLVTYYRELIAFRKKIPVFMENRKDPQKEIHWIPQRNQAMTGFIVRDYEMQAYYILYNPCDKAEMIKLPSPGGKVINNGSYFIKSEINEIKIRMNVQIPKKSMVIIQLLEGKKLL